MKKIVVNEETCIACGACMQDEEHFTWSDSGISKVVSNDNLESEALANAIDFCPVGAISIVEDNAEEKTSCGCGEACTCGDACNCTEECNCSSACGCNHE